jgi:Cu-processing system permease protein
VKSPLMMICRQEFTMNRRNRWVISFSLLFAALTLATAYFGMVTSGYAAFQDFIRTSASIINLSGFLVPLFALMLGVFSFLTNREHLEVMVTQPISRSRVLFGKYLGLVLTAIGASALGFGLPGLIIALVIGTEGAASYLLVVLNACLLAVVFTGLAVLISLLATQKQIAIGIALAVWIFFELLYGVLILATTLYFPPASLKLFLLAGLLGNPIDIVRVISLIQIGGPHLFGPAGATLIKLTGSSGIAILYGMAGLLFWVLAPMTLATRLFKKQNL